MAYNYSATLALCVLFILACSTNDPIEEPEIDVRLQAVVTNVTYSGEANNYTFSVTIESPDSGCDQYADWWEIFLPDSTLIYRRVLAHSHVNEQPFTRSGGIVNVGQDEFIYVRAHMNNIGYGAFVFSGNIGEGLVKDTLSNTYAALLLRQAPLPVDCAF